MRMHDWWPLINGNPAVYCLCFASPDGNVRHVGVNDSPLDNEVTALAMGDESHCQLLRPDTLGGDRVTTWYRTNAGWTRRGVL